MRENGTGAGNDYKEQVKERVFEALEFTAGIYAKTNGVRVKVERLSGKTHIVHVSGNYTKMRKFTDDLYLATKRTDMKWVKVFYEGMVGRWRYSREVKRIRKKGSN